MERVQRIELGRRRDGSMICRYHLINDDNTNYLLKAQSYFTKEEKKIAKFNHKHSN